MNKRILWIIVLILFLVIAMFFGIMTGEFIFVSKPNIFDIIFLLVYFIVFPSILITVIGIKTQSGDNSKKTILIDVLSFIYFMLYSYIYLYINSVVMAGFSSDSSVGYMMTVYYRNFIGMIYSIMYSFLINFQQMKKYLARLKIIKYKENIFIICLIVALLLLFYFTKLCNTW